MASAAAAPPSRATTWLVSRVNDEYAELPRRAASWAHALREALSPLVVVRPLSLVFVAYAGLASWARARRAGEVRVAWRRVVARGAAGGAWRNGWEGGLRHSGVPG